MARVPECMRRSRKHLVKPARSNVADARAMQLETAKQIMAEIFHTGPRDVEDMIAKRLLEKRLPEENSRIKEKSKIEDRNRIKENGSFAKWGTWPGMFQIDDRLIKFETPSFQSNLRSCLNRDFSRSRAFIMEISFPCSDPAKWFRSSSVSFRKRFLAR